MIELDAHNIVDYLRKTGRLDRRVSAVASPLSGGVSNVVLLIRPDQGADFVVKQSRQQLRTELPWFSRLDRIWREMDAMTALAPLLPAGAIPAILFADRDQYLFAMQAVEVDHVVWKTELLEGTADLGVAATSGEYLAAIHRGTCDDGALFERFGDREVFDQLRLDPFYRQVALVHPDLKPHVDRLIDEMLCVQACLVHADFSPKNILLPGSRNATAHRSPEPSGNDFRLTLVDFETAHYGDPAFDLGFCLSHLLLKTVLHTGYFSKFLELTTTFWNHYRRRLEAPPEWLTVREATGSATRGQETADDRLREKRPFRPPEWRIPRTPAGSITEGQETAADRLRDKPPCRRGAFAELELERRAIGNLAGCMLARIDGKSTVDYLPQPSNRQFVREFASDLLRHPPERLDTVFRRLGEQFEQGLPRDVPPGS